MVWFAQSLDGLGLIGNFGCRCKDRDGSFMVETTAWEGRERKSP